MQRILACMRYLNIQNLPLRGHVEKLALQDGTNVENLLSLLRLVTQFNPLLANYLKHATETPKTVSYLSPQIQTEFIHLLASTVQNQLINDIKRNKYYGLLFDSTPDISHREQMSQVARYVDADFINKKVSIKESFSGFIEIPAKDAVSIENTILGKLNCDEISLTNCRSQCYDNAVVMAGHTSGVQQRIMEKNHIKDYL
ncbi:zinc finger MYM-type protein 1-like [Parasteatoda tepidariorum]|uniref:zinc finger MYM-type protein 1-like n=1 Tax=Parasteatoda tepidariorum TaxID=114398 RepID=UPI0039BC28D0